ncbi:MAG TPA: protein kinase [Bacteroidota bacterium]|nr:protein kinase [Bacteroidota bacterium]
MIGQTISHYTILEKLGEGGMGVVYKAQDTKLDRFVALKFLPAHLAASEQDKARFVQEAKSAAALNHPNVCSIIDIQEHDGQMFIVMEFVDGQTLQEKKGTFSHKQAIDYAIQIAEGLAAAHEKGVVHRDIKPENIMIRKDGIVQVMDFGLAKLQGASRLTKEGSVVGTVGYMSPEQVQGHETDYRTDIFSFGVIFYEMLTGASPFKGVHETAILYEIVNVDPAPPSTVKPGLPPEVDALLEECLAKEPDERFQSAKEIVRDLRKLKRDSGRQRTSSIGIGRGSKIDSGTQNSTRGNFYRPLILGASFVLLAIFSLIIGWNIHKESSKEVRKFQWPYEYDWCVLSPDGKKIAYSKGEKLWIRRLDKIDPIEIKNDGTITNILWSPNSEYIAYFAGFETSKYQLRKISINGTGNELIVKTEGNYYPRFWGIDDSIVVTTWDNKGSNMLLNVPSSGGELKPMYGGDPLLSTIRGNLTHVLGLPDGKTILLSDNVVNGRGEILIQTGDKRTTIYSGPPESSIGRPVYSNSGHILFPLSTLSSSVPDIWAIPFDLSSLKITGNPFLVVRNVNADRISVTENGMLSYVDVGNSVIGAQLVLLSRAGQFLKTIGQTQSDIHSPAVSPDGQTVATMSSEGNGKYDIWLHDVAKGTKSQLSFDIPETWRPSWSPSGKEIVFQSGFFDSSRIYVQGVNGHTSAKLLMGANQWGSSSYWSADGRFILFTRSESQPRTHNDLWYLELGRDSSQKRLFESRFNEDCPYMSPDGRFVAFQSDKSGQWEVYVTDFPNAQQQWQISIEGGLYPQWVRNEIFFVTPKSNELMSAKVKTSPGFRAENPEKLFSADAVHVQLALAYSFFYTVTRDGKNIIAVKRLGESNRPNLIMVENWFEDFKDKR